MGVRSGATATSWNTIGTTSSVVLSNTAGFGTTCWMWLSRSCSVFTTDILCKRRPIVDVHVWSAPGPRPLRCR